MDPCAGTCAMECGTSAMVGLPYGMNAIEIKDTKISENTKSNKWIHKRNEIYETKEIKSKKKKEIKEIKEMKSK